MDTEHVLQIATLLAVVISTIGIVWKFGKSSGALEVSVKANAEDTQEIRAGIGALNKENSRAHTSIHDRLNELPCGKHGERLARVEAKLNGL